MLKNIKLIATDLDGTILDHGQIANLNDLKVLLEWQERKGSLTIVTGQDWTSARQTAMKLEIDQNLDYIVCNNGAYVSPVSKYQPLFSELIPKELVQKIYHYCLEHNWCWLAFYDQVQHVYWNGIPLRCQSLLDRNWDQKYLWDDIVREKNFAFLNVLQMMIFVPEAERLSFEKWLIETKIDQHLLVMGNTNLESMPIYEFVSIKANKGNALTQLVDYLKLDPQQVVVFGDNLNDLPMLEKFPHSVVVGNAVAEAKKVASYLTASNLEGGVGQFIQTEIWGEK